MMTLPHELAQQLKTAGFPQTGKNQQYCGHFHKDPNERRDHGRVCTGWAYHPLFDEIIDAIGPDFSHLDGSRDLFFAYGNYKKVPTGFSRPEGTGKTPTVAATNLYLLVNPPKTTP